MHTKIITLFIVGAVFAAGLIMVFGGYVFAAENYNSSKSNTSTGIINRDVGNLLIDYGYGGDVVNQVTEALARGVATGELRIILSGTSARSPAVVEEVLLKLEVELERLGVRDTPQSAPATGKVIDVSPPKADEVSTPDATGIVPSAAEGTLKPILPSGPGKEISAPGTGDAPQPATVNQELHRPPTAGMGEQRLKSVDGLDSETRSGGFIKLGDLPGKRAAFGDSAIKFIKDLKATESKEQSEDIRKELRANRQTLQKSAETLHQNLRENAKTLRENFRENMKTTIGHVDHGKTARLAVAHGKGLRMINRYRSAIARFDHILGRLESRIEKIRIEIEAQGLPDPNKKITGWGLTILLIEEAKNAQALNKAKLAELEAKYESLLLGENPGRVTEEARAIAQELKSEIEKLRDLLDDIKQDSVDYNSSRSNVKL